MHKVSVIIPVYNGELYLRECLDSVCAQTLTDIQIICVDDGSTDSSCDIIREYMARDSRMMLLQQENQYCGIARNNGLEHSDGAYVTFWDCDDTFEPDALECMYNRAMEVDADICLCKVMAVDETYHVRSLRRKDVVFRKMPKGDFFNRESNEDNILTCTTTNVWSKLFRRAFLDRIHLRFPPHRNAEDFWFTWIALCSADRITAVDKPLINYRVRSVGSESNKPDTKDPTIIMQVCCLTARYLKEHGIFPERSFVNTALTQIQRGIKKFHTIPKQLEAIEYLQKNCLEELCIRPREPGFYDSEELERVADHLLSDTPMEFLGFLNHETFVQLSVKTMKLNAQKDEVKVLRAQLRDARKQIKVLESKLERLSQPVKKSLRLIVKKIKRFFVRKKQTKDREKKSK